MRNLPDLAAAVQRNCDISDARHAGDYGLCTFLLKMREYYRWENELPFGASLARDAVGHWLRDREERWDEIESEPFLPLPLAARTLDPFEAEAANRELLPQGVVYSAGYGPFGKPLFFLARLLRVQERGGFTVIVSSCEYARELAAPPAMLQGRTIFLRMESVRRYLWEKIEEWQWRKQGGAMARALVSYDFIADTEAALERMAADQAESMILHELGEAAAGEQLGEGWREAALSAVGRPAEPVMRAARDLLADCLSTLPALAAGAPGPALHFYFATFDAARRQLFPEALAAYEDALRLGSGRPLVQLAERGRERWLAECRALLVLDAPGRDAACATLLRT